ncbi:MAG: 3'-5' exonuclease domain-containing protein 2 [Gammaproteobacteria bacterium]|nr:3'-5' exonuclease domain-containing protein 2 [Gammaproteobacteria bacterium]
MKNHQYIERPTREAMRELPKFEGLPLERICLVRSKDDLIFAHEQISKFSHVGFDTESKPVFVANQPKTGPHLLQVSTQYNAFLFLPNHTTSNELLSEIIQSENIVKVGFGLKSDRGLIYKKLGFKLRSTLDLSVIVRRLGYRQKVGLQAAVAIVLEQYLQKSKSLTTSNWARNPLTARQKLYAANDAYASFQVYMKLTEVAKHLLVTA